MMCAKEKKSFRPPKLKGVDEVDWKSETISQQIWREGSGKRLSKSGPKS
jgi:hypothetical protein